MTTYKYIFFDVANTLLYKRRLMPRIAETLAYYDIDIAVSVIQKTHRTLTEKILFPNKTSRQFYEYFNAEFLKSLNVAPRTDVVGALYENCKGLAWEKFEDTQILNSIPLPMGIISNWDSCLGKIVKQHFDNTFFPVVGSADVNCSKPDTSIYRKAMEHLACEPCQILYIGDSPRLDYHPATEVGMTAILIDRDLLYDNFPGLKINSLTELNQFFIDS